MTTDPENWVAAFPMYTRPEVQPAFDALWEILRDDLRAKGLAAPDQLTVVTADLLGFWKRPDLLISQTCGFPYRHFLHRDVTLLGAPDFGLLGCDAGYYHSVFVVRSDDPRTDLAAFRGAVFASNDAHSQSGHAAPLLAAWRAGVRFGTTRFSGAHIASAQMVAEGQADIAGLDAVSWRHMQRFDPWAAGLRALAHTPPTPGLPFITAHAAAADTIAQGLRDAISALPKPLRDALTLQGLVPLTKAEYLAVQDPPQGW